MQTAKLTTVSRILIAAAGQRPSERALSERARQQTKIVQLLKISILLEPQSMLVESHFTNMQRARLYERIPLEHVFSQ
jgi:hypothetical protein